MLAASTLRPPLRLPEIIVCFAEEQSAALIQESPSPNMEHVSRNKAQH